MTVRHLISDRRSAGQAAAQAVDGLGLASRGVGDALRQAVREAAYNVADWAGTGEVVVEQAQGGAQIVVLDHGPGIHATMRDTFPGLTEEEIVLHATKPGVSSTGEQFRGFGLWSAVGVSAHGVSVVLETGGVTVLFRDGAAVPCSKSTSRTEGVSLRFQLRGIGSR
ncbi:MAG: ATP-binding protein [Acidimicrobiaceae bacterium]|nr:ATP-binding protein [Acidimicrobiaceae bacterium]